MCRGKFKLPEANGGHVKIPDPSHVVTNRRSKTQSSLTHRFYFPAGYLVPGRHSQDERSKLILLKYCRT